MYISVQIEVSICVAVQTAQSVGDVTPPPTTAIMADRKWVLSHIKIEPQTCESELTS